MPFHAASKQNKASHQLSSGASELKSEHSEYSSHDLQGYDVMRPAMAAVPKTKKSGEYAHAIFSVAERSTTDTPILLRALDFAHVAIHHPVSQAIDCFLSVYIG